MEDQNKNNEIKKLKEIMAFCESMISLDSAEKRSEKIIEFFEDLKKQGVLDDDFVETDENRYLKSQYIKVTIIYDDLSLYNGALNAKRDNLDSFCRIYQATKNSFLPLALLKSHINGWSRYHSDNEHMNALKNKMLPGLEFANHVRNKITGHIENEVIDNSVQWEPTIFRDSIKDNENLQRLLLYRSLLESAINSYIDGTGKHMIFNQEIDFLLPKTCDLFYSFLKELINNSLEYLHLLKAVMNSKIIYFHGLPANLMINAGETEFKTKNKGR